MLDIPSHVGGLLRSDFPPTRQEYDLRALLDREREGHRVDDHEVMRSNACLARGLELVRGRRSDAPTRFDGMIGARPELDPTAAAQVVSATRLETWVQCPFKYFMQYVLRVAPIDEVDELVELTAIDRGTVVHEVLDDFVSEVLARPAAAQPGPDDRWTDTDHQRLTEIAHRHLTSLEARGLTGWGVFWRPTRRAIVRELQRFLSSDDEYRAEHGARPAAAELGFGVVGAASPALEWVLPDGRVLRFRGAADRVDTLSDGGLSVLDYKTGSPRRYVVDGENPDAGGSVLQLPIYARAAQVALGRPDAAVWAGYWFVSDRGKYRRIGYQVTPEVLDRFDQVFTVIADGIGAGIFVPRPEEPASFVVFVSCRFCDPDGLGTRHRWAEWESKRAHPALAAYRALVDPDAIEPTPTRVGS